LWWAHIFGDSGKEKTSINSHKHQAEGDDDDDDEHSEYAVVYIIMYYT
jgi:hypothetical protein